MALTDFLSSIIILLLGGIGYFIKKIFDKTEEIGRDVSDIKPKVKILWELEFATGASPLALNDHGQKILRESGIKEIVDSSLNLLMEKLRAENPQNAYQVQEGSAKVLRTLAEEPMMLPRLQEGAFKTGVNVDTVLFVGGLYLRDLTLPKYNFALADIDDQPKGNRMKTSTQ